MLKRQNRLGRGVEFNNSYSFSTPQFILKIKNNGLLINRFGVVVSKKIDKRAIIRNKIKRIFRSAFIKLNNNLGRGHDILFIVRRNILDRDKDEIYSLIRKTLGEKLNK